MKQPIRKKRTCKTCWYKQDNEKCYCVDSDYLGEVVGDEMWCGDWFSAIGPEDLSNEILLGQIAEECAELIHAIEKFRRVGSENPTPVSAGDAWIAILEEVADVQLTTEVFRCKLPDITNESIDETKEAKYERWCCRIHDRHNISEE